MPNKTFQVHGTSIPLFSGKTLSSKQETQILTGESYHVLATLRKWLVVRTYLDNYEGFMYRSHHELQASHDLVTPSHAVNVAMVNVYCGPTFKSVVTRQLPFNALVKVRTAVQTPEGKVVSIGIGRWIFLDQLRCVTHVAHDFVDECLKLVGQPYIWGGRDAGWDCSALLQAGCIAAGIPCDRDVGPQSRTLGKAFPIPPRGFGYRRGDLIFWTEAKGRHVVIMINGRNCVHATVASPHRRVLIQPFADVVQEQLRDGNGLPTIVRRMSEYQA